MPNRLAGESSPYLQQHAGNPVDWYPWAEEAFAKARAEDKPIFLSIGYSTCHWCHVMEHESFEDDGIAQVLNDHFVPIKVDREERPDVDRIYMLFVQATTGSGGWPMSVWLTPSLEPFFGGTYFPPASRWGRPGFSEVLQEIARLWHEDRPRLERSARDVVAQLREIATAKRGGAGTAVPGPEALTRAVDAFRGGFDRRHGGFGGPPKFPRPSELLFLLREAHRTGDGSIADMVGATLRAMALGGMHDHVGGGFHRYSVDAEWRVPHFEKMLYDQAQIGLALVETAQFTGDPFWAAVAEDTFAYVRREMTDPDGGFYSAEDADSLPPESVGQPGARKSEGAFYLWGTGELRDLLGEPDATIVGERFGFLPGGNAPHDPQGEFGTKNIPYTARGLDEVATATSQPVDQVVTALGRARQRMFEYRASRPRPHLDDKVLVSWNGLMIAALARAARTLGPHLGDEAARESLRAATRAATFVRTRLWDAASGQLLRRFRKGDAAVPAYADDYASMVWGALELFQATGESRWLEWAITLQRAQDARFWDEEDRAWFDATDTDRSLLFRMKEDYDGAEPAASSISAGNLLTLAHLVGDEWPRRVEQVLARYATLAREQPRAIPFMMSVLSAWHRGGSQVVVVGRRDREDTRALEHVVARAYRPFAIVIPVEPGPAQETLAAYLPFVGAMREIDGVATAYVCRDFTCDAPVTDPKRLSAKLSPES